MKFSHLSMLLTLWAVPVASQAAIDYPWSKLEAYDHSDKLNGDTFALYQPEYKRCLKYWNTTNTPVNWGVCTLFTSSSNKDALYSRMQFVDNQLKMASNKFGYKCLHVAHSGLAAKVSFRKCDGSENQKFTLRNHLSGQADRYRIQSLLNEDRDICLSTEQSTRTKRIVSMEECSTYQRHQIFELAYHQEPAKLTMVNRGWYNMSFKAWNSNQYNHYSFEWGALNSIRQVDFPVYGTQGILNVDDDSSQTRQIALRPLPGGIYQAETSGTSSNRALSWTRRELTPQVELYSFSSYRGNRYFITEGQRNLLDFSGHLASYKIPDGWEVRFYEGINYTGRYYTRNANNANDYLLKGKIRSVRIMHKANLEN